MSHKALFLQQSYKDCTEQYIQLLTKAKQPVWDYVIITASNDEQAKSYEMQIDYRLEHNMIPKSTHYAVIPDRDGKRIGSGGATLNVLDYVHKHAGSFDNQRILVIHSGGDSKRVPQYSACGKLFSPVPRLLPNGRHSTLFDEFMISMSGVAGRIGYGMLVCCGDALLLFNPLQIDFYNNGAAALSIKEPVEIGKNHGVFNIDDNGNVGAFLHKKSVDELSDMGAVDKQGYIDIDTGAVVMDTNILNSLYSLIDTQDKFDAYVNEKARLSFYADFLYPLASNSTLENYYNETPEGDFTPELHACRTELWEALNKYSMKLIRMSPSAFIHFGTTRELLELMTANIEQYAHLGWSGNINTNNKDKCFSAYNSYISQKANIGNGCYIEDSYIHRSSIVGNGSIISGVTLDGQVIPEGVVLHGLKLKNGKFTARIYGVNDNPKENKLFGKMLDTDLWSAKIYPACDTIKEAVDKALLCYKNGFSYDESNVSLMSGFNMADATAILPWQDNLNDKVKIEQLSEAIDSKEDLAEAVKIFNGKLSKKVLNELLSKAESCDNTVLNEFSRKIRIYYSLYLITENEDFLDKCFDTISSSVLSGSVADLSYKADNRLTKDEVIARLPVRVNWGGGWSDTPPYCLENGGTVLNSCILLNNDKPVEAVIRKIDENKIILASTDSNAQAEFTDIKQLQDSSNPYDPFALHKAALIACEIIPYKEDISVEDITKALGGGIYLSTRVINIPRGSGLGTSSILAGACVKAIYEMLGQDISDEMLYNKVLCLEQIMSTGGGWQDQVGGLAPKIKLVTSDKGISQSIKSVQCNISEATLNELNERFALIYSGQRRLARNLLREIVGNYISGNKVLVKTLGDIQLVARDMYKALESGDIDHFAQLLNQHWELSKQIDKGCTNTCIDMIFNTVDDLIDGKMICGAGGGGFLQVMLKKGVTKAQLQDRLYEVFRDSGVSVWECSFE